MPESGGERTGTGGAAPEEKSIAGDLPSSVSRTRVDGVPKTPIKMQPRWITEPDMASYLDELKSVPVQADLLENLVIECCEWVEDVTDRREIPEEKLRLSLKLLSELVVPAFEGYPFHDELSESLCDDVLEPAAFQLALFSEKAKLDDVALGALNVINRVFSAVRKRLPNPEESQQPGSPPDQ